MGTNWKEEIISYPEGRLQLFKGGDGPPLLILHGAGGNPGWLNYHEMLSKSFTVYAPSHPGYDKSDRIPWVDSIPAVAHYYHGLILHLNLKEITLFGLSMGGWISAEMAAMNQTPFKQMILVAPVGIKPERGQIAELFTSPRETVQNLRFYDKTQVEDYENIFNRELTLEEQKIERGNREMAASWCWQPYFYNPNLQHYLRKVSLKSLIVWGKQDYIVPVECADLFHRVLVNSEVKIIDRCSHIPHAERPREFLDALTSFLKT